jgi:hypothetical protein
MTLLAATPRGLRPDAWDFPLLLHVLGAMLLVGSLVLAGSWLLPAWRGRSASMVRLGYRSLLLGVLPGWIVMRVGAEWIASKEDLTTDSNLSWVSIGFTTADASLVVIVIATILAGLGARRAARAGGGSGGLGRASAVLVSLLVIAYLVTLWAMTTKPT